MPGWDPVELEGPEWLDDNVPRIARIKEPTFCVKLTSGSLVVVVACYFHASRILTLDQDKQTLKTNLMSMFQNTEIFKK